jgi:hypothetical protein
MVVPERQETSTMSTLKHILPVSVLFCSSFDIPSNRSDSLDYLILMMPPYDPMRDLNTGPRLNHVLSTFLSSSSHDYLVHSNGMIGFAST